MWLTIVPTCLCMIAKIHSYILYVGTDLETSSSDDEDEIQENSALLSIQKEDKQNKALTEWFVIFLSLWQTMFCIPANAINVLLKFIHVFLTAIANCYSNNSVKAIAESLPRSLFAFQKYVNIEQVNIVKYVVCPSCYSLYKLEECFQVNEFGEKIPKNVVL